MIAPHIAVLGTLLAVAGITGAPVGLEAPPTGRVLTQSSANEILSGLQAVVKDPLAVTRVDVQKTTATVKVCKEEDLEDCVSIELSDPRAGCEAERVGIFCASSRGDVPDVVRQGLESLGESIWTEPTPSPRPKPESEPETPTDAQVATPGAGKDQTASDEPAASSPASGPSRGGPWVLFGVLAALGLGVFWVVRR